MDCHLLGSRPGPEAAAAFLGLAREGQEGVVIVQPNSPVLTLGTFQATDRIKWDAAGDRPPVLRLPLGGPAAALDSGQLLYHLVLAKDNEMLRGSALEVLQLLTGPAVWLAHACEVEAAFRPVNKVVLDDGLQTAEATMGDVNDFLAATVRIRLRPGGDGDRFLQPAPGRAPLGSLLGAVGRLPEMDALMSSLLDGLRQLFGRIRVRDGLPEKVAAAGSIDDLLLSGPDPEAAGEAPRELNRPAGRLTARLSLDGDGLAEVKIYGDFMMLPAARLAELEAALVGQPARPEALKRVIREFLADKPTDMPGLTPSDLAALLAIGE